MRKYTPSPTGDIANWNSLHADGGTTEYLVFLDDETFTWSMCDDAARISQSMYFPNVEGIDYKDGKLLRLGLFPCIWLVYYNFHMLNLLSVLRLQVFYTLCPKRNICCTHWTLRRTRTPHRARTVDSWAMDSSRMGPTKSFEMTVSLNTSLLAMALLPCLHPFVSIDLPIDSSMCVGSHITSCCLFY